MRWLVVAVIGLAVGTAYLAHREVEEARVEAQEASAKRIQETDNFYYGFCEDVRQSGLGHGQNYERLCAN